jgi:hypothetical protein
MASPHFPSLTSLKFNYALKFFVRAAVGVFFLTFNILNAEIQKPPFSHSSTIKIEYKYKLLVRDAVGGQDT